MGNCLSEDGNGGRGDVGYNGKGCKVNVYTSDPRLGDHKIKTVYVPADVSGGPRCADAMIAGMPSEYYPSDANGHFLFDNLAAPDAFDACHSLATFLRVKQMYQRALARINSPLSMKWPWGDLPIAIRPYAGLRPGAHYSRENSEIAFYFTKHPDVKQSHEEHLFLCRSPDVVAHMAGHAVLDALKPHYYGHDVTEETRALHESFADLTAVFNHFSQLETCETITKLCKGDITNLSSFVHVIDNPELSCAFGREFGIRNVVTDLKINDVVAQHHDWSKAFTSAIYDILAKLCLADIETGKRKAGDILHLNTLHMCGMVLKAFLDAPIFDVTFRDIARCLIKAEPSNARRKLMKEEFRKRKFFDKNELPKRWNGVTQLGGCTTMSDRSAIL